MRTEYRKQYREANKEALKEKNRIYRMLNRDKINEQKRQYYTENKDKEYARCKKFRASPSGKQYRKREHKHEKTVDRIKYVARLAVYNAVRKGNLKKLPCVQCGSSINVQGHHEDYQNKLDVIWLCNKCHIKLHFN